MSRIRNDEAMHGSRRPHRPAGVVMVATALGLLNALIAAAIWSVMSGTILQGATGRDEFLKFLFAVIQLELIGGIVWLGQEEYKRHRSQADAARSQLEADLRARSEARQSWLEDTGRRLRKAYVDVKRCRRILKARAGTAIARGTELDVGMVHALGEGLMDPQLELESLKWEAVGAVSPGGLFERADDIPGNLRIMEEYANHLSKAMMRFATPAQAEDIGLLKDYVGKYEKSMFESRFGTPYDTLTAALMRERASSQNPNFP